MRGLVYILDEPCRGLHPHNVSNIIAASKSLVTKGNTLIAIEHNPSYILQADQVIELGPVGGLAGGKIIYSGKPKGRLPKIKFKKSSSSVSELLQLNGVEFHNVHALFL